MGPHHGEAVNGLRFAFLISILPMHLHAVEPATPEEREAIRLQILEARLMDGEVGAASADFFAASDAKRRADLVRQDRMPPSYARPGDMNVTDEQIRNLQRAIGRAKERQHAAFTKAIHMTIKAYDLAPASRRATSVMPLTKGREIEWLPLSRDPQAHRVRSARGIEKELPQPTKLYHGITYYDGATFIDRRAFEYGVGWLASTILHERVHFEQYTTPGGAQMTREERDELAYKAEEDNVATFFDLATESHLIAEIETKRAENKAIADAQREKRKTLEGRVRLALDHLKVEAFDYRPHSDAEIAEMRTEVEAARAAAAEDLESLRNGAARDFEAARQRGFVGRAFEPKLPEPRALEPKTLSGDALRVIGQTRDEMKIMRAFVAEACQDPNTLTEYRASEFGSYWLKVALGFDAAHKLADGLSIPMNVTELYNDLQGCQFELMKAFLEKPLWWPPQQGDVGWAMNTARGTYGKFHPTDAPSQSAPPQRGDSEDRSRSVAPRFGPAYGQAQTWKIR